MHSLLEGLEDFDRGEDLERRLDLPSDLEDLYHHMLDMVTPVWYLEERFRLLLLVSYTRAPLTLRQLCFAEIQDSTAAIKWKPQEIPALEQAQMCVTMEGRIKNRCLGLLEIRLANSRIPPSEEFSSCIKSLRIFWSSHGPK